MPRDLDLGSLADALLGGGTGPVTGDEGRAEVTRIIHAKVAEVMQATGCSRNDAIRQVIAGRGATERS
jgi:hypothetical protein